ncbi:HepT-like ribonuclease domain-containing protein [Solitalea koreensis]|uniref:Uncharacterized protein n=1 Tax=Solitalea koreensis TaxID=543615 RepID=A0A521ARL0_9SPHI|nr:HepT-like ribonuclease domain-containing protein [Solitalea koreensis]SMO37452.1 Protein of unknown function DUF86 [Solitalea koreensis]
MDDKQTVVQKITSHRNKIKSFGVNQLGDIGFFLKIQLMVRSVNIEWKKMAGTRDRLIHNYFGVDYDIVWDFIVNKLPDLQYYIDEIIKAN